MTQASFLYGKFLDSLDLLGYEATASQERVFRELGEFFSGDDGDIYILNGYAGTGRRRPLPPWWKRFPR